MPRDGKLTRSRLSMQKTICFSLIPLALLFVGFLVLEALCRLLVPAPTAPAPEEHTFPPALQFEGYYLPPPNAEYKYRNELGVWNTYSADKFGLRNRSFPDLNSNLRRIVVLGDSFIAATNTDYAATFCVRLEQALNATGVRTQVYNGKRGEKQIVRSLR